MGDLRPQGQVTEVNPEEVATRQFALGKINRMERLGIGQGDGRPL
jgi:hypothetical protein